MQKDFLSELLGDQVRAKLLRLLVSASDTAYTVDDLRKKLQIKNGAVIQRELTALMKLGVVKTQERETAPDKNGKNTLYKAWAFDREHPYAQALRMFIRDTQQPIDEGVVTQLRRTGRLALVIVSGRLLDDEDGEGRIDMLIAGEALHEDKIQAVLRGIEAQRGCEVQYALFSPKEFKYRFDVQDRLIRDMLDYPHHILLDKLNLL
ncbi:hypothetical protein HY413_00615 [Candidatus Kaiserbacteria bacterium]|nr:hypothetical protein [Candidatus Kaiserbacteria bacterium]